MLYESLVDPQLVTSPAAATKHAANETVKVVAPLRLYEMRRSIAMTIAAAVVTSTGLTIGALWLAGFPTINHDGTLQARTFFDLLKLVLGIVAGIGGVVALVVAYRRQKVAEQTNAIAEAAQVFTQAAEDRAEIETIRNGVRLFNERFTKAAEQLGSDRAAVRLAGVYAIAGLADDWDEGRQTCIDVLCGYFRLPYSPPDERAVELLTAEGAKVSDIQLIAVEHEKAKQEREVRRTVLGVITSHLRGGGGPGPWSSAKFNFREAVFDGGDFSDVVFSGVVDFTAARFVEGDTDFLGAKFEGEITSFDRCRFEQGGVFFAEAKFHSDIVSFEGISVAADVSFHHAEFQSDSLSFEEAEIDGGDLTFEDATIRTTSLHFALTQLKSGLVSFDHATIQADFVHFNGARIGRDMLLFTHATIEPHSAIKVQFAFDGAQLESEEWPDFFAHVDMSEVQLTKLDVSFGQRLGTAHDDIF